MIKSITIRNLELKYTSPPEDTAYFRLICPTYIKHIYLSVGRFEIIYKEVL